MYSTLLPDISWILNHCFRWAETSKPVCIFVSLKCHVPFRIWKKQHAFSLWRRMVINDKNIHLICWKLVRYSFLTVWLNLYRWSVSSFQNMLMGQRGRGSESWVFKRIICYGIVWKYWKELYAKSMDFLTFLSLLVFLQPLNFCR